MNIFFYLIMILFSLGQLGRLVFFDRQINFYLFEIFLFIFFMILFLKLRFGPINSLWKNNKKLFIFPAILFLSFILDFNKYSFFQNLVGLLYFLRLIFYFLYFFYLDYFINKNEDFKKTIHNGLLIFTFFTIISTTTQYFLYPDLRNLMYLGWDPHLMRTFGVFFDTAVAGAIYGLIFFNNNFLIIKLIYLLFLVLSYSRGVILAFIISLIFLFLQKKQSVTKLLLIVFSLILLLIILPKPFGEGGKLTRVYTVKSRINDYKEGLNLFFKKPLLGFGYNRLRYVRRISQSNAASNFSNSYLTILTTSGFLGLLGFFIFLKYFWMRFKRKRMLMIFIGITSLFDNVILHPFILFLFLTSLFDN
ncbi:MAG: O-antigen ligase family protein [Microgenomates group bacterium]